MLKSLKKSDFLSKVILLVTGAVISQSITYLLSPIITRLYSPEEMSYLTLLIRISSFFAVISTARYELAFPLPKRDEHAFSLYKSTFTLTLIISFISAILVFFIDFFKILEFNLNPILYFIPFSIFLVAFNSQGVNWAIRIKDFNSINSSKILQSGINSILCIIFGWLTFGVNGLIIAYLFSLLIGNVPFFTSFFKTYKKLHFNKFKRNKFLILRSYSEFPRINLPHVLMDLTKDLFVAFCLIYMFDKEVLGLYDFSYRMLRLPINLIGVSISQVLYKKSVDLIDQNKSIFPIVSKTILMLFLFSIIPFGLLFFFGEDIFSFVFGSNWKEAGYYSEIMSPWLMMNFILSPVSQIPTVLNKQKTFFVLSFITTFIFIVTLTFDFVFPFFKINFHHILFILSITQTICMSLLIFWILRISNTSKS